MEGREGGWKEEDGGGGGVEGEEGEDGEERRRGWRWRTFTISHQVLTILMITLQYCELTIMRSLMMSHF